MVKGISKQVIVVHPPDKRLFDQAIFILSDHAISANEITDEALLKEAKKYIQNPNSNTIRLLWGQGILGVFVGSAITGLIWFLSVLL